MRRLAAGLALALAACSGDPTSETTVAADTTAATASSSGDEIVIEIEGFRYPTDTQVPADHSVRWVNTTAAAHTIVFTGFNGRPMHDQPDLDLPGNGEATANLATGAWSYICGIHEYMSGTVAVGLD